MINKSAFIHCALMCYTVLLLLVLGNVAAQQQPQAASSVFQLANQRFKAVFGPDVVSSNAGAPAAASSLNNISPQQLQWLQQLQLQQQQQQALALQFQANPLTAGYDPYGLLAPNPYAALGGVVSPGYSAPGGATRPAQTSLRQPPAQHKTLVSSAEQSDFQKTRQATRNPSTVPAITKSRPLVRPISPAIADVNAATTTTAKVTTTTTSTTASADAATQPTNETTATAQMDSSETVKTTAISSETVQEASDSVNQTVTVAQQVAASTSTTTTENPTTSIATTAATETLTTQPSSAAESVQTTSEGTEITTLAQQQADDEHTSSTIESVVSSTETAADNNTAEPSTATNASYVSEFISDTQTTSTESAATEAATPETVTTDTIVKQPTAKITPTTIGSEVVRKGSAGSTTTAAPQTPSTTAKPAQRTTATVVLQSNSLAVRNRLKFDIAGGLKLLQAELVAHPLNATDVSKQSPTS